MNSWNRPSGLEKKKSGSGHLNIYRAYSRSKHKKSRDEALPAWCSRCLIVVINGIETLHASHHVKHPGVISRRSQEGLSSNFSTRSADPYIQAHTQHRARNTFVVYTYTRHGFFFSFSFYHNSLYTSLKKKGRKRGGPGGSLARFHAEKEADGSKSQLKPDLFRGS
jgi:hypothetical protein